MLNKKSFAYQAAMLASSNMLLLLLNFVYRILIGRLAGPEGLGVFTLAMQVYAIIMSVCISGMCIAVTNLSASLLQRGDYNRMHTMVRFAISCFFILLAIMALPILLMREFIAERLLGDPRTAACLGMILLCIALTGLENIFKALFNGTGLVKYTAISELGEQSLRILIAWVLLARLINGDHSRTALLIMAVMTLSEVYSALFLSINYYRKILKARSAGRQLSLKNASRPHPQGLYRAFLKIAIPAAATAILANVFSSIATIIFPQRLLLAGYTHTEAVSALGLISGMVTPILMLPSALISALSTLLLPSISAGLARDDMPDLRRKINRGIEATGLLGIPATAILLPFASLICTLLFGQAAPVALIAMVSIEVVIAYYLIISISILNGLGRQKQVFAFAAGAEILQVLLVWVLSAKPQLHVYGYLLGMMIGDMVRILLGYAYIHRIIHTRPRIFSAFVVPIACAIILYCCARIGFFYCISLGCTILGALSLCVLFCTLLYLLLLRLLGVRPLTYLKRVIIMA